MTSDRPIAEQKRPAASVTGATLAETSLPPTEVEYALILSQMIDVAEQDPSQLRLAIYEFARTKLVYNTMNAAAGERERLSLSLEAAIAGVEKFSRRRGGRRIAFRNNGIELPASPHVEESLSQQALLQRRSGVDLEDKRNAKRRWADSGRVYMQTAWAERKRLDWFATTLFLLVCVSAFVLFLQRASLWRDGKKTQSPIAASVAKTETKAAASNIGEPANPPTLPTLPKDYGVYAVSGTTLLALQPLSAQVPDKRMEMSTPISQVNNAVIPDGAAKFVIYRRDFFNDAPDQIEVRAVARVERVITFDSKGKPLFAPVERSWIIRNIAYPFRARPVADHPEMFLVQPEDVELPPGRYLIVLKNRGYDFNVAGKIEDAAQCVERTDALNGSFYSDCQR